MKEVSGKPKQQEKIGLLEIPRQTCIDYCPDAECGCRFRSFAGCNLPLAAGASEKSAVNEGEQIQASRKK